MWRMIAGVEDVEAYLHERLGNYEVALALHIAHWTQLISSWNVVLSGQLPLLQLPATTACYNLLLQLPATTSCCPVTFHCYNCVHGQQHLGLRTGAGPCGIAAAVAKAGAAKLQRHQAGIMLTAYVA